MLYSHLVLGFQMWHIAYSKPFIRSCISNMVFPLQKFNGLTKFSSIKWSLGGYNDELRWSWNNYLPHFGRTFVAKLWIMWMRAGIHVKRMWELGWKKWEGRGIFLKGYWLWVMGYWSQESRVKSQESLLN